MKIPKLIILIIDYASADGASKVKRQRPVGVEPRCVRRVWEPVARGRRSRTGRTLLAFATAIGLLLGRVEGRAHGDLHEQIESVTQRIQQGVTAELFLKRGELHRAHHDYEAALVDYDRAAELDAALEILLFCRGRTLFEAGKFTPAKDALDQFLQECPDHAEGHLVRARVLARLRDLPAAKADYDRAIEHSSEPRPEYFVERARVLMDLGEPDRALAGLQSGMEELGTIPTLQMLAIEIEIGRRRFDAALQRLDSLMAQAERKESWLARRGEILARAGRPAEARRAYSEALEALEQLPSRVRNTPAMQQFEAQLRTVVDESAHQPQLQARSTFIGNR